MSSPHPDPLAWREKYGTTLHSTGLGEVWAMRAALEAVRALRPAGEPVAWRWRWASADDWRVFGMSSTEQGRADFIRDMEKIAPIVVEPLAVASPIIDAKVAHGSPVHHALVDLAADLQRWDRMVFGDTQAQRDGAELAKGEIRKRVAAILELCATPTAANASEGDGWKATGLLLEQIEYLLDSGAELDPEDIQIIDEIRRDMLAAAPASPDTKEQGRG